MSQLAVLGQALWERSGPPPTLTVTDAPERWCSVELATAPGQLGVPLSSGGVASWASWEHGLVRSGPVTVPGDAWSALRSADHLYYRAHSSASEDAWVDHQVTVSDRDVASAPSIRLCDVWTSGDRELLEEPVPHVLGVLDGHPELPAIVATETVAVLICLHRFSPKRPVDPSQLELVVLLAGGGGGHVRVLVQRLDYRSLSPIVTHGESVAGSLTVEESGGPGEPDLLRLVGPEAVRWSRERRGPFLVLRDNGPAPGEEGGTCILVSGTDRCSYSAKTKWRGPQEVVVP